MTRWADAPRVRRPDRRTGIPLAIVAAMAFLMAYDHLRAPDYHVFYKGERRPAVEAGLHTCHFVNYPQVRCFDSWVEVLADLEARWPRNYTGLLELLGLPPVLTPQHSAPAARARVP